MLGELEDPDQSDDPEEGERCTRLSTGAAHRRHDIYERDVVRYDSYHVDDVLEVIPECKFGSGKL